MLNKTLTTFLNKNKKNISKSKILCIGDIILDHYILGNVERVSPEAPVPILIANSQKYEIGGAGNVARNISNMGAKTTLICLSGNDTTSIITKKLFKKNKNIKTIIVKIPNFKTPIKTRFIKKELHLLRVDYEEANFKLSKKNKSLIIEKFKKEIHKNDLVVISDYNKGLLDSDLIKKIIKISNKCNKIIIADPKKINLSLYHGVDILTPNQKEITDAAKKNFLDEKNLIEYSKKILKKYKIEYVLN